MLKFEKKFSPKNSLLQHNLEQFLNWRLYKSTQLGAPHFVPFSRTVFQTNKQEQSSLYLRKNRNKFYKSNGLNFMKKQISPYFSSLANCEAREANVHFFPEKKPFMQFWTLPLLGASFLSFLAIEKPNSLRPLPSESLHNVTLKSLSSPFMEKKGILNFDKVNKENIFADANFSPYKTEYRVMNAESLGDVFSKSKQTTDLKNLCVFYLNLTEQKLLENSNYTKFSLNAQNSYNIETLLLKSLYLQNSVFHHIFYPLYDPLFVSSLNKIKLPQNFTKQGFLGSTEIRFGKGLTKEDFLQKLNLEVGTSNSKSFENDISVNWKKNPSLSYLKSNKFFEVWVKNLKLKTLKQHVSQIENMDFAQLRNLNNINNEFQNEFRFIKEKLTYPVPANSVYKSSTLKYFEKFLETVNQQKQQCMSSYENLKEQRSFEALASGAELRSEELSARYAQKPEINKNSRKHFQKFFFQSFESKYKSDAFQFYLKSKFSAPFVKITKTNNRKWQHKTLKTANILKNQKMKNILKQSLFINAQKNSFYSLRPLLATNKLEIFDSLKEPLTKTKNDLERKLKAFLYDLFLLQELKNNHVAFENSEPWIHTFTKLKPNFLSLNKEIQHYEKNVLKKNPEKFIQEMNLYIQFEHIYKTLMQQYSQRSNDHLFFDTSTPLKNKAVLYFSKSPGPTAQCAERPGASPQCSKSPGVDNKLTLENSPMETVFEMTPKQTHFKKTFIFSEIPKFYNPQTAMFKKSPFSTGSATPKFVKTSERKYETVNKWLKTGLYNLSEASKGLTLDRNIQKFQNLKSFSGLMLESRVANMKLHSPNFFRSNMRQFNFQDNTLSATYPQMDSSFSSDFVQFKKKKTNFLKKEFSKPVYRKTEKIFRTYLSIKNAKGLQSKNAANFLFQTAEANRNRLTLSQNFKKSKVYTMEKHKKNVFSLLQKLKRRAQFSRKGFFIFSSSPSSYKVNLPKGVKHKKVFGQNFRNNEVYKDKKHSVLLSNNRNSGFLNSPNFLQKLTRSSFLKKADFSYKLGLDEARIFERKKASEKKRRLKKLKLENRRRKKRKRFYPRPLSLRFQLYSRFLQKRHPSNKEILDISKFGISPKGSNLYKVSSVLNPSDNNGGNLKYTDFSKNVYGQRKSIFANATSNFGNSNLHQKELYKISNETLTEFERLCWKSYWLRSNLKPYILKIQKSLKRMKNLENIRVNNKIFAGFLQSLSTPDSLLSKNTEDKTLGQSGALTPTLTYFNIRENFNPAFERAFSNNSLFKQIAKKAESERLLYERLNDEIKNVKSQLTVDGQSQARSYKTGRQKIEKSPLKPFWNAAYAFQNNYLEPNLISAWASPFLFEGFKSTDFTRTDFANKGFPTLRLLWACNKTQLFTYQPNNLAQNLWANYKKREQTKNNQTRKFLYRLSHKFRDLKDFMEVQAETNKELKKQTKNSSLNPSALNNSNYNNQESLTLSENSDQVNNIKTSDGKFLKNKLKNKKLQNLSVAKTSLVNKKIQTFGGLLLEKNYRPYLRNLKFQLQKNPISKQQVLSLYNQKNDNFVSRNRELLAIKVRENSNSEFVSLPCEQSSVPWFETNMESFIQKRQFHFWWSLQVPKMNFPFFQGAPFLFSNLEETFLYTSNSWGQNNPSTFQKELILQAFWVCSCACHLAIFFALVRIPEIRSLVKFQILVLSKLSSAYFIGLFAIYDLLKNYQEKIKILSQTFFKASGSNFNSTKNLRSFSYNSTPQALNKYRNTIFGKQTSKLQTSASRKSKSGLNSRQSKTWIQSTLHWNFSSRLFFKSLSLENDFVFTKSDKIKTLETFKTKTQTFNKAFELLMLTGISPLYKYNLYHVSKFQRKLLEERKTPSLDKQQTYNSLYTGIFWQIFVKNFETGRFLSQKQTFFKDLRYTNSVALKDRKNKNTSSDSSSPKLKSSQKSSKNQGYNIQIQSLLSLIVLGVTRASFTAFYLCFNIFYKVLFQIIDLLEGTLFIFYKFLEKPAEVMVDWIAEVFLIEWTSDIYTYVPEAFDTATWTSVTKFSRSARFFYGIPFGFVTQRFFLESTQLFYQWLFKSDTDLRTRQKKGVIFWDIWSEILIQAAEKYKMNLSSLSTIKEEQELLMENLLEQKPTEKENETSFLSPIAQELSGGLLEQEEKKKRTIQTGSIFNRRKKQNFLNQKTFLSSLNKLEPLMKFIQDNPSFHDFAGNRKFLFVDKNGYLKKNPFKNLPLSLNATHFKLLKSDNPDFALTSQAKQGAFKQTSLQRWSVSQYLNTQGKDTDLFMDIHPPKSFTHVSFLKSYLPAQEVLGSLVCDIYAGLFASKVSKNVLIVGAPGMAKSFFIQALAGETELKIVLDNAHRYAFVNGGVPVGMKLLREVFDSIALHTPCLFLLEDVHVIGERRPMLISDDETSKTKELAFGAEQEEVHEKNKLVYQLSKHALSHYKKPYKGDFSLAIPTNHFCYDLFLGVLPPRKRRSELSTASPFPVQQLESALNSSGNASGSNASNSGSLGSFEVDGSMSGKGEVLLSSLQLSVGQIFAPPATSPFHVLLMKEQKKLKPKKLVKDIPWSGLSYDQWMLLSKNNYSVRVKVALLAETAMKNLSVKLDMITDLLVIIDSVRSNRGFVVFATTHLPAILDPALRRPGRLDETIALPLLPNIQTRFEIFKTHLSSYSDCMDFLDWSLYSGQMKQNENQLSQFLTKNILLLLNAKNPKTSSIFPKTNSLVCKNDVFKDYPIYSLSQAFQSSMRLSSLWNNPKILKKILSGSERLVLESVTQNKNKSLKNLSAENFNKKLTQSLFTGNNKKNSLALSYTQAGQFLSEALLLRDQTTYSMKFSGNVDFEEFSKVDRQKFMFQTLYGSSFETKQTLFKLFAAKISEFFVFQTFNPALSSTGLNTQVLNFEKSPSRNWALETNPSNSSGSNLQSSVNYWQAATAFLDSLFQKRYLYNKNSVVSKMLFFEDNVILGEPPSPPNSSILMPARKFENYKRTLRDFVQKPGLSINDKLQMHQKQRFLKLLYNIPVQTRFVSNKSSENTSFYSSFKDLGYLDLLTLRPSSTYAFYKNRFFNRQRFSFLNQWWNGQLAEHNAETTYLSHIDWRSMFVPSISSGDIFIDFPDAEQYYNPRNRRWFLQSQHWSYWLNFETDLRQQISERFLLECFTQTSEMLHSNREMVDYLAYRFLRNHQLQELDLLQVLVRFYKKKHF